MAVMEFRSTNDCSYVSIEITSWHIIAVNR